MQERDILLTLADKSWTQGIAHVQYGRGYSFKQEDGLKIFQIVSQILQMQHISLIMCKEQEDIPA